MVLCKSKTSMVFIFVIQKMVFMCFVNFQIICTILTALTFVMVIREVFIVEIRLWDIVDIMLSVAGLIYLNHIRCSDMIRSKT